MRFLCVFLAMMICFTSISARVYEKHNADGTVTFSDTESGGGKPASLPPISVSDNKSQSTVDNMADNTKKASQDKAVGQYQSLRILGNNEPLSNLVNNPNMRGVTVVAELMPQLDPDDQVELMYNGKWLVRVGAGSTKSNLDALYGSNKREDNLINRQPPKASASIQQEPDKSMFIFKITNLNRVNFPPGLHTWRVRVLSAQGQLRIESKPRQFNVHYSELIHYKQKPVQFVNRMKILLKLAAMVTRAVYSPI